MRKLTLAVLATALGASFAAPANAATVGTTLGVRITIQAACNVALPSDLDFGTQGVLAANIDQTQTISVTCTTGTPYNIGLGTGGGASITTRRMINGASQVGYQLYSNSTRTAVWGITIGTDTIAANGTGAAVAHTVYGRVPPQATPAPGVYTDTVAVTVTY